MHFHRVSILSPLNILASTFLLVSFNLYAGTYEYTVRYNEYTKLHGHQAPAFSMGDEVSAQVAVIVFPRKGIVELAAEVPEGLRGHTRDRFIIQIPKDPTTLDYFKSLVGHQIEAKVQVTGDATRIDNQFHYPSNLLSLKKISLTNPSQEWIQTAKHHEIAVVEGKIIEISENSIMVENSSRGKVTVYFAEGLPSYGAALGKGAGNGNLNKWIRNIETQLRVGHEVRLKTYVFTKPDAYPKIRTSEFPALGIYLNQSAYLLTPDLSELSQYEKIRENVTRLINELDLAIERQDYQKARQIKSKIVTSELIHEELEHLKASLKKIPENDRPLILFQRTYLRSVGEILKLNMDEVTIPQFKTIINQYAENLLPSTAEIDVQILLDSISLSKRREDGFDFPFAKEEFNFIFKRTIETRLRKLEEFKKTISTEEYQSKMILDDATLNGYFNTAMQCVRALTEIEEGSELATYFESLRPRIQALDSPENQGKLLRIFELRSRP